MITLKSIPYAILLLIVVSIAHLYEEVRTGFRRKFPIGEMPLPLFVGINVVLYTFYFSTLFLSLRGHSLAIPFAWFFALVMLVNGIGHIGIIIYRRRYFPGGITAFLMLAASSYLIDSLR
jgi:1,4-dihydroxy-2-naphthoate octaprenyltransferase